MRRSGRILLTGASCAAGLAVALGVSACGGGSGEAAAKISTAAGSGSVTREAGTRTEGSASTPVAETVTTTETVRETTPAQSLTVQKNVNAVVSTASTPTTTTEPADSGGMPWWGWALIAAGVAAVAVLLARRGRGKPSGEQVEARREAVVTSWTAQGWAVVS